MVCLGLVCCNVRREIENSTRNVTNALHYTQRAAHSLAFACPEPPQHDQSHAAAIKFFQGKPCTLTCPLAKKTHDLPNGGMIWFDEVDDFIREVCALLMGFILLTHRVRIYHLTPVAQPNPLQQMSLITHQVCVKLVSL